MVADIIMYILLVIGLFFSFVGVLGILRMHDVYGRLQASTCIPTLGNICLMIAGVIYAATHSMGASTIVKLVIIMLMILCTNPISNHALLKGAYKGGVKSAKELVINDYKEDDPE
jgi:multicomponent Na+:H+ antiporter subunit G